MLTWKSRNRIYEPETERDGELVVRVSKTGRGTREITEHYISGKEMDRRRKQNEQGSGKKK